MHKLDAVVVGAGPNGLAAGIRLAQAGLSVHLIEANDEVGGGSRSASLTLPGFVHDVCSAIHPMAAASPYFKSLKLDKYGLEWIHPTVPLAHPLGGERVAVLQRSLEETAASLGRDGTAYDALIRPLSEAWEDFIREVLQPIPHLPRNPVMLARFGLNALQPSGRLARRKFEDEEARALFAGLAAHSLLPLNAPASAAIGLVLAAAGHTVGWPMPRGGSQSIADALASLFHDLGGEIETGREIKRLEELPPSQIVLLDLTPRQLIRIAGDRLSGRYRRRLERFRYGPAVFKIDYAMREPVPWLADACKHAGTIHVGGNLDEIAKSEKAVSEGRHPERPFVLLAEHSRFDDSRAPSGGHTLWAYCHVPHGSTCDMSTRIEAQIERFAPGFRDCILERHTMNSVDLEGRNANLIGGDINGGSAAFAQLLARPVARFVPYRTPIEGVYLCSASTPPSGGVHGMCGFHAAEWSLRDIFGRRSPRTKRS